MKFRTDLTTWADCATAIRALWPQASRMTVIREEEGDVRPFEVQDANGQYLGSHDDPTNPAGADALFEGMFWNGPLFDADASAITVLGGTFTFTSI